MLLGLWWWSVPSAAADSWASPTARVVKSPNQQVTASLDPDTRTLVVAKGKTRLFARRYVNRRAPVTMVVADSGHVATFDDWHSAGYDHAAVIYAPDGKLVLDRRLEELLTADELGRVEISVSSRWWRKGDPKVERGFVSLPTSVGVLRFELATGAQHRAGRVFPVPTDEERLIAYLSGTRQATVSIELQEPSKAGGSKCTIGPSHAECRPLAASKEKHAKRAVDAGQLAAALRAALPLVPRANVAIEGSTRQHWYLLFSFDESGYQYRYEIVLGRHGEPPALVDAVLALRKLTPLR